MPNVRYRSVIPVPARDLFTWHRRPGAFERLVPPWQSVEIVSKHGDVRDGDLLEMGIQLGPARVLWRAEHSDFVSDAQFRDTQIAGPFNRWVHTHRVHEVDAETSVLDDEIEYELPLRSLSQPLVGGLVAQEIRRMFRFRHMRTRFDLIRHHRYRSRRPLRVSILGSGRIADQLNAFITSGGHQSVTQGQTDFVVNLMQLHPRRRESQVDLHPTVAWVSVTPTGTLTTDTLRWPRHIQIHTPAILSELSPDPSSNVFSIARKVLGTLRNNHAQIPWIAEDDLIGAIHSTLLSNPPEDSLTVRAPYLSSKVDFQRAAGWAPPKMDVLDSDIDYRYMYSKIAIAIAARSGRLVKS